MVTLILIENKLRTAFDSSWTREVVNPRYGRLTLVLIGGKKSVRFLSSPSDVRRSYFVIHYSNLTQIRNSLSQRVVEHEFFSLVGSIDHLPYEWLFCLLLESIVIMPEEPAPSYTIKDVWAHNVEEEFRAIRKLIVQYPHVAMVSWNEETRCLGERDLML